MESHRHDLLGRLTKARLGQSHPVLQEWFPPPQLRANMQSHLSEQGVGWYERYEATFRELTRAHPEFLEYTHLESEEDLSELAGDGLLFEVWIDGSWAGITGVALDGEEGVEGYLMQEIILSGEFRGRGFGAALQRHLSEQLPEPQRLLLGTIDSRNAPAMGAAVSVGRRDLGGYLWCAVQAAD